MAMGRSCTGWLLAMGILCIIFGLFIGYIFATGYGPVDDATMIQAMLFNTYTVLGYLFLGIGIIAFIIKKKNE